jgi:hypothetical protein
VAKLLVRVENGDSLLGGLDGLKMSPVGVFGLTLLDGVLDPVGEYRVRVQPGPLLEVVRDARRDGLTRDCLAAFPREQDERHLRVLLPDGLEKLDAVLSRHFVVGDNAVVARVRGRGTPVAGTPRGIDDEPPVFPLERLGRQLCMVRLVIDVEKADTCHLGHALHIAGSTTNTPRLVVGHISGNLLLGEGSRPAVV